MNSIHQLGNRSRCMAGPAGAGHTPAGPVVGQWVSNPCAGLRHRGVGVPRALVPGHDSPGAFGGPGGGGVCRPRSPGRRLPRPPPTPRHECLPGLDQGTRAPHLPGAHASSEAAAVPPGAHLRCRAWVADTCRTPAEASGVDPCPLPPLLMTPRRMFTPLSQPGRQGEHPSGPHPTRQLVQQGCLTTCKLLPSASSSDLCGHNQMRFTLTAIIGTDPRFQFASAQQPLRFRHGPLVMHPFRLNGVEPWTFGGQRADHTRRTPLAPRLTCRWCWRSQRRTA